MNLCFIPEHDTPKAHNHIVATLGPPSTAANRHTHDPLQGLIVLGRKDRRTHHWHNDKIMDQVRRLMEHQPHIFWTLSTSPRTPLEMVPMLVEHTKYISGTTVVPFEETGPAGLRLNMQKPFPFG